VDVLDAQAGELAAVVVVAVDAQLRDLDAAERLEVVLAEVAQAQDDVDGSREQPVEAYERRLVGKDERAGQIGIPQRGNQRSMLRCLSPAAGTNGYQVPRL
jgi:hypothetical protein